MTDGHRWAVRLHRDDDEPVTVTLTEAERTYLAHWLQTSSGFAPSQGLRNARFTILNKIALASAAAGQSPPRPGSASQAGVSLAPDASPPCQGAAAGRPVAPPAGGMNGGAGLTAIRVVLTVITVAILLASVWLLVAATTP